MPATIVVGAQWGDEGKGKVVDVFSAQSDLVVRYQGGANAGHTLIVDGKKTVLHLVPSGILHPHSVCVVAAGVVLDVATLSEEILALKAAGLLKNPEQLKISDGCTVILDYHKRLDAAREHSAGHEKIGTTGKGIGPAYEDRAARKAILFGDLFDLGTLKAKLLSSIKEKDFLLTQLYKQDPINVDRVLKTASDMAECLRPYRCKDTSLLVNQALKSEKKVLFEGAQGTLLDTLHGTYPFVTSSSTLSGSACVGTGVGPTQVNKVVGIAKAYTTRVGSGPFPTELHDKTGEHLQQVGKEFGATTGRKRRCGWLDLVALRYAIRINGITNIALMKIDVLTGLEGVQVCNAYELDGELITEYPVTPGALSRAKPVYQSFRGWGEDLSNARSLSGLPKAAQAYITFISKELKTPVDVVSVGPGREETLWINPLFV